MALASDIGRMTMQEVKRRGGYDNLLSDIVALLEQARTVAVRSVNTIMTAEH